MNLKLHCLKSNRFVVLTCFLIISISCKQVSDTESQVQLPDLKLIPVNIPDNSEELIAQLGCNTCHSGLPGSNIIRTKAPDLEHAGLRYNPAYLFISARRKVLH